ncbi:peptidase S64 family protein [Burkholderia pseudomallei]|nr:peptidase S64 family protein [Burkholderia pseudomallei]
MAAAFEVASAFAQWALSHNLLPRLPAHMEAEYIADVAPVQVSELAEQILRRRAISSIVFNDDTATVYVYTEKRVTQKELEDLPRLLHGCDVLYPHGWTDVLVPPVNQAQGATYTLVQSNAGQMYYACGSSISPGNEASAGTLGAIVTDAQGVFYGLTNNHVTGGCNHSGVGLPILAPGVVDVAPGGQAPFTIGYHERVLPYVLGTSGNVDISANTDAAIFRLQHAGLVSSQQGIQYDTPTNVVAPIEGMKVAKVGRTTGYTEGTIVGRELRPVRVKAGSSTNGFEAFIWFPSVFVIHGETHEFSAGGDSGSLVVSLNEDGTKSAVGLVFCGGPDSLAPGNMKSMIVPLAPILQRLNVTLVGGHNVTP